MSLEKFISLLVDESLYFCQVEAMQQIDPFESSYPRALILKNYAILDDPSKFSEFKEKIKDDLRKSLEKTDNIKYSEKEADAIIRTISSIISPDFMKFQSQVNARTSYINCWHMNEHQSDALWKIYGEKTSGIAIKSSVERLVRATSDSVSDILMGSVEYHDYEKSEFPLNNGLYPLFRKRMSFSHESELRLCLTKWSDSEGADTLSSQASNPKGINVPCKLDSLISTAYIHPLCPAWAERAILKAVEKLWPTLKIERSTLYEAPNYGR